MSPLNLVFTLHNSQHFISTPNCAHFRHTVFVVQFFLIETHNLRCQCLLICPLKLWVYPRAFQGDRPGRPLKEQICELRLFFFFCRIHAWCQPVLPDHWSECRSSPDWTEGSFRATHVPELFVSESGDFPSIHDSHVCQWLDVLDILFFF